MTSAPNFNAVSLPEPHSCTAALAFQFFAKSCGRLHVSVSFKWGFNFQWIVKSNLQHSVESPRSVHTRNSYITYEPRLYAMRRDCMERERERERARARCAKSSGGGGASNPYWSSAVGARTTETSIVQYADMTSHGGLTHRRPTLAICHSRAERARALALPLSSKTH